MQLYFRKSLFTLLLGLAVSSAAFAQMVYHRGNTADPETLDHHLTSTVYESHVINDLYEGLVVYDAKATVMPGAAESWEISDDGLTYTFKLRDNAKWSNGDPVTASDFVFAFRRIMTPSTGAKYANILFPIKGAEAVNTGDAEPDTMGVTAVDDQTLKIELEAVTPYFLELLTHQTGKPMHQASVEEHGSDFVQPGNMVSNGAYMLSEFVPNSHIKVDKNSHFHDADNVQIDTVFFYPTEDRGPPYSDSRQASCIQTTMRPRSKSSSCVRNWVTSFGSPHTWAPITTR